MSTNTPTTASQDPELVAPTNPRGRVVVASLIGTSIEFFDFYAYATAAVLVFPSLFFTGADETTRLLASLAVFGVAFVARPVGSILFGHFGDRVGRKGTLVGSLLVMGIATFLIGCLPTAQTPGWEFWAPALLVVMRFCQGLGLGGEWSGAALLATENAPANRRAIWGTFPQLGAPIGFILANTIFVVLSLALTPAQFQSWGWRVPFLISIVLVGIGLYVRFKLIETPAFQQVLDAGDVAQVPLARAFKTAWRPMLLGTFIMLATYVLFYMMTTFTMTYGTTADTVERARAAAEAAGRPFDPNGFLPGLGYARTDFLTMLIVGVVFFGIFTLVAGPLAERWGRRRLLIGVTIAIALFGLAFSTLFDAGTVGVMAGLIIGLSLMGLTFGPMGAVLPELFATSVRYTGSAISYNVASILGAAVAPSIFVGLWKAADGSVFWVGAYLTGAAVLTLIALVISKDTADVEYTTRTQ